MYQVHADSIYWKLQNTNEDNEDKYILYSWTGKLNISDFPKLIYRCTTTK